MELIVGLLVFLAVVGAIIVTLMFRTLVDLHNIACEQNKSIKLLHNRLVELEKRVGK